ncbi:MAG TPA: exodeoxyribonuclease VII large subunit [Candidatus Hydrogenedentes bacterium]|nr:exodeoxyribonuclease VII large subunit [Candidatus Hydrogenedentota bacterium]HPG67721.1 exodeoxyribonuclease VII large subunit [Candidatus Hydrogenedentota bacterium]
MNAEQPDILSVSQLTRRVKSLLENEISYVWVAGEISNWRVSPAGHAYFTLKDKDSQLGAVMFRGKLMRLKFGPEDGLEVVVHGLVTVYEVRGTYQIVCEEMQPKGMGALQLAFEKLRRKLEGEGLFDPVHKKSLPLLPRRIGIVTSPTGAAIRDMLNVIGRRFANVHVLLYPARVQGDEAAEEIVEGIRALDAYGVDVIIVGRGGGSIEDLWPFNEEIVVRAVYQVETPIISAVGHEIDYTLTDFAADLRAPTPSAAAELVVQEQEALVTRVRHLRERLAKAARYHMTDAQHRVHSARSSYVFQRPEELVRQRRQQVDEGRMRLANVLRDRSVNWRGRLDGAQRALALLSPVNQVARALDRLTALRGRLRHSAVSIVERARGQLRPVMAHLDALSPLAILARGYALAWRLPERALVRDAGQLSIGDQVGLRFGAGGATATVNSIEVNADDGEETEL